jgi:hypothetical protein
MECQIEECDTKDNKIRFCKKNNLYLCNRHYHQMLKYGKIISIKNVQRISKDSICSFCGSKEKLSYFSNEIFCRKHYDHMRLFGYCKDRTIFDENEIIKYENYAEIILYALDQEEKARAIIDIEDIEKIKNYKWNLGSNGYPMCTVLQKCMHTLILNLNDNQIPDHINRNKLDNRKKNLRIADTSKNSMNSDLRSNNTSGVTGISWDSTNNKWASDLKINNLRLHKRFIFINDAIKQRLIWEKEYFKEFAPQKYLFKQYGIE